jgi:hypothetical protein
LYCFPDIGNRQRYEEVWKTKGRHSHPGYIVDVKEGNACGPGENRFSSDTVSVSGSGNTLTLEFAYNTATQVWEASEVRVLRQNQEAYGYGRFEFSVQSTQVIDTSTNTVVDDKLPETLVLGLFTWDPTDDYATNENWNHEVDVEISRWGNPESRDAQFLVQPPTQGIKHRFYTGLTAGTYNQNAPQVYAFDWEPAHITWTTATDQRFEISSERSLFYEALGYTLPDYIQCLPANVEVRINLWNTEGMTMENFPTNRVVRVVIDKFQFTPSSQTHVASGGYCTKHCHCNIANSQCVDGICTPILV